MVVSRVGNSEADKRALEDLESLAEKGITEEELETVIRAYEESEQMEIDSKVQFRIKKEAFKREKTQDAFESGAGGFKRQG